MAGGGILLAAVTAGEVAAAAAPAAATPTVARGLGLLSLIATAAAPVAIGLVAWRRWYRLPGAPTVTPVSPPVGLGLFITMFVLGMIGVQVARRMVLGDAAVDSVTDLPPADHARILMGHAVGQTLGVVIYLWLWRPGAGSRRRTIPAAAVTGLVAMVVVWPIVSGTSLVSSSVARAITGGPVDVIAHDTLKQLVESPMGVWLAVMAILVVFVAPLLEEVLYRGILQRTLMSLDLGRWTAIIITSAVFVAMHLGAAQWHALPSLFVLSLGFGWAYERTGRLAAPITMHVLFNALNLALAWLTIEA